MTEITEVKTEQTKNGKFHILLGISIVAILLLLSYAYKQYNEKTVIADQLAAVTDTVTLYKTKEGKNAAIISVLKGSKKELLAIAKYKDKEIYELVKKTKNIKSVTSLKTETRIDTISKVDTMYVHVGETSNEVDSILITKEINNPFYQANIRIINDSIAVGLKVKNDFNVVIKEVSNGFFKGNTLKVDVVNNNPYTYTTGLSSYEFTPKKKVLPKILIVAGSIVTGIILLK